jgi:hypothetical protein
MKAAVRIFSIIILAGLTAFYMGCDGGGDPKKSETDEQIEMLNGTWQATTVTLDGTTPALDHSNFTITISGSAGNSQVNYTVSGRPEGPSPWNSSGIFEFDEMNVKQKLIREDDIPVNYSVTDGTLVLDFTFSGTPYDAGRVSNVSGSWHFEFAKQ